MKSWLLFITLFGVIVTTSVESQTCPQEWFAAEYSIITNNTFPRTDFRPDANFSFFRDVAKLTPEEIDSTVQNAIDFYATRFGLDFSSSDPDELGVRRYQNATFTPLRFPVTFTATVNRWLRNGNTNSVCYAVGIGGLLGGFTGFQMLHGTYGGEDGILANRGHSLGYGYFSIDVCPQQPLLIQFQTPIPGRPDPIDGYSVVVSDLFHRTLGRGLEVGASRTVPHTADGSILRFEFQSVHTFRNSQP